MTDVDISNVYIYIYTNTYIYDEEDDIYQYSGDSQRSLTSSTSSM